MIGTFLLSFGKFIKIFNLNKVHLTIQHLVYTTDIHKVRAQKILTCKHKIWHTERESNSKCAQFALLVPFPHPQKTFLKQTYIQNRRWKLSSKQTSSNLFNSMFQTENSSFNIIASVHDNRILVAEKTTAALNGTSRVQYFDFFKDNIFECPDMEVVATNIHVGEMLFNLTSKTPDESPVYNITSKF